MFIMVGVSQFIFYVNYGTMFLSTLILLAYLYFSMAKSKTMPEKMTLLSILVLILFTATHGLFHLGTKFLFLGSEELDLISIIMMMVYGTIYAETRGGGI